MDIIPEPVSVEVQEGEFSLTPETAIVIPADNPEAWEVGNYLKQIIDSSTSYELDIITSGEMSTFGNITLSLSRGEGDSFGNSEGYHLTVSEEDVHIKAPTPQGLFYGVQTLLQLFPDQIMQPVYTLVNKNTKWTIPAVAVEDYPRFSYRGMLLDVGRHHFPVEFIKKYIDLMAYYKLNRFHWHLTEDQGWRIEIKEYPKLTKVGAWRDSTIIGHIKESDRYDGKRYGGYYTQEQIREVVEYAEKRFITIIPEIEMPGHSSAALASYPEFGCKEKGEYNVQTSWGVKENVYCPSEETFTFLENILTEVMDLFPSEYIHIGGDEAPKIQWEQSELAQQVIKREGLEDEKELQSYFITRMEKFLNSHGRQIIGWDEILEGGLAPNATVMSWRGIEGGIEAAKNKHNVVMTPNTHLYLDHYQADPETEPLAISGYTTLEKTYSYEPVPEELTKGEEKYILGAQGNLWTEYIKTSRKAEYMAYPRALALAEVVWSPKSKRNWQNFWNRLQTHFDRLDILDVNVAKHYMGVDPNLEQ